MNNNKLLENSKEFLFHLLFPPFCIECEEKVDAHSAYTYICTQCAPFVHLVEDPACTTCGHPYFGATHNIPICPFCKDLRPKFLTGTTLLLYNKVGKRLVRTLKYQKGEYVLNDIEIIARKKLGFKEFLKEATMIPVPLHPKRLRKRTFNQSLLIAQVFQSIEPSATILDCLRRTRHTETQTSNDRRKRLQNIRNAFEVNPKYSLDKSKKYIIIDDVFTTGATLNECCTLLKKIKIHNLHIATLCHG